MLSNYWYVACSTRTLRKAPVARTLLGEPLVLFRDATGAPVALADRCPHRNAPLSSGTLHGGQIRCPYHGWEFGAEGACTAIPSLAPGDAIPNSARARALPACESDGYIWVWVGEQIPAPARPPALAPPGTPAWAVSRQEAVTQNAVENVIENFIDTSHTGYLHGGLFRQPAANVVRSVVKQLPDGVSIDLEEQAADGLLGRLLVRKGERITHQDRFILPSIVRVAYEFGTRAGVVATHLFTPEDAWRTRIYVHFAPRLGPATLLATALSPLFGGRILRQDVGILDRQGQALRETPARFVSVGADTANGWIAACLRRAADGAVAGELREKVVQYKL